MKFFDKIEEPGIHYFHPIWIDLSGYQLMGSSWSFLSMQVYTGHHVSSGIELDPPAIVDRASCIGQFVSHDARDGSVVLYTEDGDFLYLKLDVRPRSIELSSWKGLLPSARQVAVRWLDEAALAMADLLGIPADQQFFRD